MSTPPLSALNWEPHRDRSFTSRNRLNVEQSRVAGAERSQGRAEGAALFAELCEDLQTYIQNNDDAMIDRSRRWQKRKPVPTFPAESRVTKLLKLRMNEHQWMRWSPQGAHRVFAVRAAVLDGPIGTGITASRSLMR